MKKSEHQLDIFEPNKIPPITVDRKEIVRKGYSPVLYLNNHYLYAPLLLYFLSLDNDVCAILGRTHRSGVFCIGCDTDQFIEIVTQDNPRRISYDIRFVCNQCKKDSLVCYYEFRSAIDIVLLPTIKDEQLVISEDGKKMNFKIFREDVLEKAQTIIYDPDVSDSIRI